MRLITVLGTILLLSVMCFAQARPFPGPCLYGCGPYIPLITTPMLSLETASPNPVGARNATGGLIAGATNSTLSMISGNLDASYTVPVWYAGGGTPIISPAVNFRAPGMRMGHAEYAQHKPRPHEVEREEWTYFAFASPVEAASAVRGMKHAARTYTNADVQRQNQNNGLVKYDNKTEKIQ